MIFEPAKLEKTQQLLGAFVMGIAQVDNALMAVFAALHPSFKDAAATYYRADRAATHRELTNARVGLVLTRDDDKEAWAGAYAEHQYLHQWRNRLLHDGWLYDAARETYRSYSHKPAKGDGDVSTVFQDMDDAGLDQLRQRCDALFEALNDLAWCIRNTHQSELDLEAAKSLLHARYGTSATKEDEGVWTDFGDGISVKVRHFKSPVVQNYQKSLNRPYADMVRRGPLPANIAEELMENLIANAVIANWRGVTDKHGNVLEPTAENKLAIIKELPEFRDEILGVSFERDGFKLNED